MVVMLSILAAAALVAIICALLLGWGGLLTFFQRLGLAMTASGMVMAAIPRFQGHAPGWGDVLMLAGLLVYLVATYGPQLFTHVDGLDGSVDGKVLGPFTIKGGKIVAADMEVDRLRAKATRERGQP